MVNFINILRANFRYESLFGSIFCLHVTRIKLLKRCLYKKFARKMLMKLTPDDLQKFKCSVDLRIPFAFTRLTCKFANYLQLFSTGHSRQLVFILYALLQKMKYELSDIPNVSFSFEFDRNKMML